MIYHGSGRKGQKADELQPYDLVVTTYRTLATEWAPKGSKGPPSQTSRLSGLYSLRWRRIVLDEGHNTRNLNTKNALAALAVNAHAR